MGGDLGGILCPPAANSYEGPNSLDHPEWPRALQEAIDRTEGARSGERQNEPWATVFQLIEDKHRRDGKHAEQCERVETHLGGTLPFGGACPFRKSYPDVLVVQSSQDRNGDNGARSLDCSMQGRIFL
jgi:hypothetical protein